MLILKLRGFAPSCNVHNRLLTIKKSILKIDLGTLYQLVGIKTFSVERHKTKTKIITLTNPNEHKQFIEPTLTQSKCK